MGYNNFHSNLYFLLVIIIPIVSNIFIHYLKLFLINFILYAIRSRKNNVKILPPLFYLFWPLNRNTRIRIFLKYPYCFVVRLLAEYHKDLREKDDIYEISQVKWLKVHLAQLLVDNILQLNWK